MTEFKVGDRVKAIGQSEMGFTDQIGKVGEIVARTAAGMLVVNWDDKPHQNNMPPTSIAHVTKRPIARILTEKIMVNGVKCRKITGFEGILRHDELPDTYVKGVPSFDLYRSSASHYEFNGSEMSWKPVDGTSIAVSYNVPRDPDPTIALGPLPVHVLTIGDIYPEATYQAILTWLKRAGSRLAKIRREEREAWSGAGADEI